ncbi:hypothetical protein FSP39_016013 [Pinctada imbricata]|uniref:Uncharacterized protein n=1 Tax=Pinctada imbricata TaxID=66713 RepID=A0AA88Y7R8_PINIB|nr:hypothetical protein FSP39_016013 [Pinctada imbricata]
MDSSYSIYILFVHLFWNCHSVQVTIYPDYLAQGGKVHYESDRWDGHHGLDSSNLIDKCKAIGTETGRWLNRDISIFPKVPQDPHRHGYPDPNHFTSDANICDKFVDNVNQYHLFSGKESDIVMEIKGRS